MLLVGRSIAGRGERLIFSVLRSRLVLGLSLSFRLLSLCVKWPDREASAVILRMPTSTTLGVF